MYKITKEFRDQLVAYLDSTALPHVEVKAIIKGLESLEEIKEN